MVYFLGVDIGGSKSHALIADADGGVLGAGVGPAGRHIDFDFTNTKKVLQEIVCQALGQAGLDVADITGAAFGMAGYDWPSDHEPHLEAISVLGLACPLTIVNDAILGLVAGTTQGWGIGVVAGTSCNCRGLSADGRTARVVGFGSLVGEGAGGTEIVEKAFHKIAAAWRKERPHTVLADYFVEKVGASSVDDLLEGVLRGYYQLGPSFSPLVFEAARRGDSAAMEVIEWAGKMLGQLVLSVGAQLGFRDELFEVVLAGGLFQGDSQLIDSLERQIAPSLPNAKLVRLQNPPVIGAVLVAMQTAACHKAQIAAARQRLLQVAELA